MYKLLGGKIRDRVRVYNGGVRFPMHGFTRQDYADNVAQLKNTPERFPFMKIGVSFHSRMPIQIPVFCMGEIRSGGYHPNRGPLTGKGFH